ncbi:MAG: SPFH domain-containing protein [Planctomycetes bacterium]|nr:SPFH domain-containing protein [Planctomycetota bacterium]
MSRPKTQEVPFAPLSGWPIVVLCLSIAAGAIVCFTQVKAQPLWLVPALGSILLLLSLLSGFFIVNPNEARLLVLFGNYRGSVLRNGFFWTNPFTVKRSISLRARNFDGQKLKVNDLSGNPIEIAAIVVWRVTNTAQALLDVDDYSDYVHIQSESAVRQLASSHPYDHAGEDGISLRTGREEVARELKVQLDERLSLAGVDVLEARLSHLAYAPEIAGAMLRRQQADAVISARKKIVEGAVGMVEDALHLLEKGKLLTLDEERKAQMVSNLLVVLCSDSEVTPVVNTGSLYA